MPALPRKLNEGRRFSLPGAVGGLILCGLTAVGCQSQSADVGENRRGPLPVEAARSEPDRSSSLDVLSGPTNADAELTGGEPPPENPGSPETAETFQKLVTPGIDVEDWERAHLRLLELGADAVPLLAEKLDRGTVLEREAAATVLALLGPQGGEAAAALQSALNDSSEYVRANAAAALVQMPELARTAVPSLIALLDASDPQLRRMAAMNLGVIGVEAEGHVEDLQRVLASDHPPEVLVPLVELLGRIGPAATAAVPRLQQISFEQSGDVGQAAATAIRLIHGESAAR